MNAVIYARFSSDMQREESIEAQVRACKYYAQQKGIEIVKIYADRATSGMYHQDKRKQFNQMLIDSKSGNFNIVLVHKLNRFGRDGIKVLNNKEYLENQGINVISVTEQLENTPEGRLMLFVITGINEYYSKSLAQEVLKGMRENALKGVTTGGTPALGYDVGQDKKLVINEREAEAVRLIFDMYESGHSYKNIIDYLNMNGFKTKRGHHFGKNSLYDILKRERYKGVFTYEKTKSRNGKKNQHKTEKNYIRVDGGCPQIITPEQWERVQTIMETKRRNMPSNKAKDIYVLSGKLYCGLCGKKMSGTSKVAAGKRYLYYSCCTKSNGKKCDAPIIAKDLIEKKVFETLNEILFNPDYINEIAENIYNSFDTSENDLKPLKNEIAKKEKSIANLVRAVAAGTDVPEMHIEIQNITEQKNELQKKLLAMVEAKDAPKDKEEIKKMLKEHANTTNLFPEEKREFVQKYIENIYIYPIYDGGGKITDWNVKLDFNPFKSVVHSTGTAPPAPTA